MMTARAAVLAIVGAVFAGGLSATAQPGPDRQPIAIGIVRSDGMLFPLARLQNGQWSALSVENSSGDSRLTSVATTLSRVPWSAFPLNAGKPFPLKIGARVTLASHCAEMEGFRTNAPTRPFPAYSWPMPKTAIAIQGSAAVTIPSRVEPPYDTEARRASRVIVALTQSLESERLDSSSESPLNKYTATERGRVPVQITTLVRHSFSSFSERTVYYFEARKRYPRSFDLFVSGWVVVSDHRAELTQTLGLVADEDYKNVESSRVLGVVELEDRYVWVLEVGGYEHEAYDLMEFQTYEMGRRVLRISGGGC